MKMRHLKLLKKIFISGSILLPVFAALLVVPVTAASRIMASEDTQMI
ncbi:hypothetical protein [Catenibacillus scindens]